MPTYQYACTECGERLEVVQKFSDEPLTVCPACSGRLRKLFSPVGVVFKGSGFYKTDSRASSKSSGSGDSGSTNSTTTSTSGADGSKADSGSSSSAGGSAASPSSPSTSSGSGGGSSGDGGGSKVA